SPPRDRARPRSPHAGTSEHGPISPKLDRKVSRAGSHRQGDRLRLRGASSPSWPEWGLLAAALFSAPCPSVSSHHDAWLSTVLQVCDLDRGNLRHARSGHGCDLAQQPKFMVHIICGAHDRTDLFVGQDDIADFGGPTQRGQAYLPSAPTADGLIVVGGEVEN